MRRYLFKFCVVFSGILFLYLLLRKPWKRKSQGGLARELAVGFFCMYMTALMALALEGEYRNPAGMLGAAMERIATGEGINMVPFRTMRTLFRHFNTDAFLVNIVGNVVMFMPWGFGLVLLWSRKRRVVSVAAHSLLLPLFIETAQLFIGRNVDVDDIILNFIGGCAGAGLYFLLKRKFPQSTISA